MVKEDKEKLCLFFASDYHFEMISLPYISKSLKENKNVIVVTENNLNNTMNKLLSRINIDDNDKSKLTEINWNNDDLTKFKEIKKANQENTDTVIFVKGRKSYIENINNNIENWINTKETKIINCYDINEVQDQVKDIASKYDKILSTSGVEKLL